VDPDGKNLICYRDYQAFLVSPDGTRSKSVQIHDSADRGGQFAAYTIGFPIFPFFPFPQLSVGDAWMQAGLIDVQDGVSSQWQTYGRYKKVLTGDGTVGRAIDFRGRK